MLDQVWDYDKWQLDIKNIMNILYLKIKDNQPDLAMCLSWILAENVIYVK